jgi:hypothetical protein
MACYKIISLKYLKPNFLIRSEEEGRELKGDQSKSENWKSKWNKFDKRFMLPLFTNYNVTLMDSSSKRVLPIARILTTDIQLRLQEQSVKDEFENTVNHFYFTNLPLSYFS